MVIKNYKRMSGNKYKVFFDDGKSIILHENVILNNNLLITKNINDIDKIINENNEYLIYDKVLNYISVKMRCESEIRAYLNKNDISTKLSNDIIKKLKQQGYINEDNYVKSFIFDKINLNKYGPNKIKNELIKLKIDKDIIENEIQNIDNNIIIENLEKLIDKRLNKNNSCAGNVLKQKIINEFVSKGYNKEDIINIVSNKNLTDEKLYEKEYKKLYSKYSKKYSETELKYIIDQKLYQKGLKKNNY